MPSVMFAFLEAYLKLTPIVIVCIGKKTGVFGYTKLSGNVNNCVVSVCVVCVHAAVF